MVAAPQWLQGLHGLISPGGMLGAPQVDPALAAAAQGGPGGVPGATPGIAGPMAQAGGGPGAGPMPAPGGQPQGGFGGAMQNIGQLTQNPMFMAGMGLLSGNQTGQGFQGMLQGLQGANQQQIAAEDRLRNQALRNALMAHFGMDGGQGNGDTMLADETDVGTAAADAAAMNTNGNRMPPTASRADPLAMMMLLQDQGNPYGGVNPHMLGMRGYG